jgi:cytochrome d ubiquinol oxidase subunit I
VLAAFYLVLWWRKGRLPQSKWFYRAVVIAGPAALVALIAGWITTEVGRQPWIVYQVMRTTEAVTGATSVPVGYATIAAVYAGLAAMVIWLLRRLARNPIESELPPGAGSY